MIVAAVFCVLVLEARPSSYAQELAEGGSTGEGPYDPNAPIPIGGLYRLIEPEAFIFGVTTILFLSAGAIAAFQKKPKFATLCFVLSAAAFSFRAALSYFFDYTLTFF